MRRTIMRHANACAHALAYALSLFLLEGWEEDDDDEEEANEVCPCPGLCLCANAHALPGWLTGWSS